MPDGMWVPLSAMKAYYKTNEFNMSPWFDTDWDSDT